MSERDGIALRKIGGMTRACIEEAEIARSVSLAEWKRRAMSMDFPLFLGPRTWQEYVRERIRARASFYGAPTRRQPATFGDFAERCTSRRYPIAQRRPVNGYNIEVGRPSARCLEQSPDGRGLIWLLSGGSLLNYSLCQRSTCPRLCTTTDQPESREGGGAT